MPADISRRAVRTPEVYTEQPDAALIDRVRDAARRAGDAITALIQADLAHGRQRVEREMKAPLSFLAAHGLPVRLLSLDEQGLFAEMVASTVLGHKEQVRWLRSGLPSATPPACIGCTVGLGFLFVHARFAVPAAAAVSAAYFQAPEGLMRAVLQIGVPLREDTAFSLAAALCRATAPR